MLKDKLQEEIERYNEINLYNEKITIQEQVDDIPTDIPADDLPTNASVDDTISNEPIVEPDVVDSEEIDITDLVNMTQSIKNDLDDNRSNNDEIANKMDAVFQQFDSLKNQLSKMDVMMTKIEGLSAQIEAAKPATPEEQLNMRSLDSYPYNEKPIDFFNNKKAEMERTGKNEYVLTKSDIENYSNNTIKDSFNAKDEEDENFK